MVITINGQDIEARVIQKIATEAEWAESTILPRKGEFMIVGDSNSTPINIKVGNGVDMYPALPYMFDAIQQNVNYYPINTLALPTPAGGNVFSIVVEGDYTFGGVAAFTVPVGSLGVIYWDGSVWDLEQSIELPVSPTTTVIEEDNELPPTSDAVFQVLDQFVVIANNVDVVLFGGDSTFSETGNYRTSANWISTRLIDIDPAGGEVFNASGFMDSAGKYYKFFTAADTLHQSPVSVSIPSGATSIEFTTPPGYVQMIMSVANGSGVAASLPLYQDSFMLTKGGEAKIRSEMIVDPIQSEQLLTIESNIDTLLNKPTYSFLQGRGFPQYELGNNGDRFFDVSSKRIFTKTNGKWIPVAQSRFYPVQIPTEFGWDIGSRVMLQDSGKGFIEGWKGLFEEMVKADFDRLTKYYVSTTGDNTNDGLTPETAFKNVAYAHSVGARNIIVEQGVYSITGALQMGVINDNTGATEPLIIRCLEGVAIDTRAYLGSEYTWTANGDCYQAARTNVINVVDFTDLDEKGYHKQLVIATSIAECQATAGSFYKTSSIIYVHTFDDRIPDKNIALCFASTSGYVAGENVPYVYFENFDVLNQNPGDAFSFKNGATQFDTSVYLKNCHAGNNSTGNAIGIDNIKEVIVEGAAGTYVLRDALNYHTSLLSSGYTPSRVLEIDCIGYETGTKWSGEYSSNGSTMHEGGTILRINGDYKKGSGSVIADVNAGIRSLNIGTEANDTVLNDGYRINGDGSLMWVIAGVAYSDLPTAVSIRADAGAQAFFDSKSVLPNGTAGNVTEI